MSAAHSFIQSSMFVMGSLPRSAPGKLFPSQDRVNFKLVPGTVYVAFKAVTGHSATATPATAAGLPLGTGTVGNMVVDVGVLVCPVLGVVLVVVDGGVVVGTLAFAIYQFGSGYRVWSQPYPGCVVILLFDLEATTPAAAAAAMTPASRIDAITTIQKVTFRKPHIFFDPLPSFPTPAGAVAACPY